ncbi:putative linocin/CFP29 family protein [Mobilisporobacter senegalensis]|uniref:Type 1 encapsulin shell protein n=1 Tax=Mobilisporobacter senegalensis TaxID=1329262 RepID=A0A3N1XUA7_9FIRM|nr:family 1 encapsulin nanocompartment shell protein [Mobilisporobacter senegalensis]ROR28467.1 putative linocin/CFP29 family protein [Mobilisporobacter senegalensis]
MSYLSRESSPLGEALWNQIDETVINTARKALVGRRFLKIFGPLGIGTQSIHIDDYENLDENYDNGFITTKGRKYVEIPTIYDDFTLFSKDLENCKQFGYPIDLSRAAYSAEECSRKEDRLIFFGNQSYGYEGLLTASGINKIERKDWATGENAFSDIVSALELFTQKGIYGSYALIMSPDLYTQLQRIQQGTGLLEIERIRNLVGGNLYNTSVLGTGKAALICPEQRNMDLVIGQDLATGYLEQKDFNHSFRVLETVLLRIKRKQAITVFE